MLAGTPQGSVEPSASPSVSRAWRSDSSPETIATRDDRDVLIGAHRVERVACAESHAAFGELRAIQRRA